MAWRDTEAGREWERLYREAHREEARERTRKWRLDNPERAKDGDRRKKEKNPELYAAIAKRASRASYERNRDTVLERCRQWRQDNSDKVLAYSRAHRAEHPERQREYVRKWQAANRETMREHGQLRRARERGAKTGVRINRAEIYERDGGICHICGKKVPRNRFTLDHLVPVVHGGAHDPLNVRVAHASCNSRRGPGRLPAQLILV